MEREKREREGECVVFAKVINLVLESVVKPKLRLCPSSAKARQEKETRKYIGIDPFN